MEGEWSRETIKDVLDVLQAVVDGEYMSVMDNRYIVVDNPAANAHSIACGNLSPKLVIDVDYLRKNGKVLHDATR